MHDCCYAIVHAKRIIYIKHRNWAETEFVIAFLLIQQALF